MPGTLPGNFKFTGSRSEREVPKDVHGYGYEHGYGKDYSGFSKM